MSKLQLKGVLPPMITPFKENGDVDYDAFDHNIEKWNETAPHASGPRMPRSVMKSMRL